MILMVAEILLGTTGLAALAYGRMDVCFAAVGAFVGILGGHLNGTHDTATVPELEDKIAMIEAAFAEKILLHEDEEE